MFALVWLCLVGCEVEEAPPPVSTIVQMDGDEPVEVPIEGTTRPDGRDAVKGSELTFADLPDLGTAGLSTTQAEVVSYTLNTTVAPCKPCMEAGSSIARCMTQEHPTCGNLMDVARRGVRAGEKLHETIHATKEELMVILGELRYEEPWQPIETEKLPLLAGAADAEIQVVVVVDYEDPFSRKVHTEWATLMDQYGDKVGWRLLHRPDVERHLLSRPAAEAVADLVTQGKGRAAHEALLRQDVALDDEALYASLAANVSASEGAMTAQRSEAASQQVTSDLAMAAALDVRGTPSVFVGGYLVRGARDAAHYAAMIDRLLADQADPWPGE